MTQSAPPVPAGVIPPVVTALTPEGDLDIASQEAVCARQLAAGVSGIFLAGTTGEGAFVTHTLLSELVHVVVGFTAGQVPVLVGALAPGTAGTIEAARIAQTARADGIVVTTPFYGAVSDGEIAAHFRDVAASTTLPVLAYSIPPMTHAVITPRVLEELFAEDTVVGFKDSGHDWDALAQAVDLGKRYGKNVYAGYEPFSARAVRHGTSGLVASFCNVDPGRIVRLWHAAGAGSSDAEEEQAQLLTLIADFATLAGEEVGPTSALIGGIKAALQSLGVLRSRAVLAPLRAIADETVPAVRRFLDTADVRE